MKGGTWVDDMERRAEDALNALDENADPRLKRRLEAWNLRIRGHAIEQIAALMNVSVGTAHADIRWCLDHLPAAYESAQDFRTVAVRRLDEQYLMLTAPGPAGEPPSETALRVAQAAQDMQAKLLGAYAPTKVDGSMTVKTVLVGIDADEI